MATRIVPGTANEPLARAVAAALGAEPSRCELHRFPDGELRPVVEEMRGDDVYVIQPTGPPVNERLVELLLLLDACRRGGADRLTAVVPYFGYARQDRRGRAGEAVGLRVAADAIVAAGADRIVVVDPHTSALEAVCTKPVEMLTAVPILAHELEPWLDEHAVLVAPDLGAVKLAERYSLLLHRPVVIVSKARLDGDVVVARGVIGDLAGRPAVIVDDMISTGTTIEVAIRALRPAGAPIDVTVAATHGPLVEGAARRLRDCGAGRIAVTDTAGQPLSEGVQLCSVATVLSQAIERLHTGGSLDGLLMHT